MPNDTRTSPPTPTESRRVLLGEAITELRDAVGVEVEVLAARLGVATRSVSRWEAGEVGLSFEQALAIETALDAPRGHLGAAGRFFAYGATPASNEATLDVHEFVRWEDAKDALDAAACLRLGVRSRNEFRVDPDEHACDPDVTVSTEWWALEILTRAPSTEDELD